MEIDLEIYPELEIDTDGDILFKILFFSGQADRPCHTEVIELSKVLEREWENYTVPSNPRRHSNTGLPELLAMHKALKQEVKKFKKLIKTTKGYKELIGDTLE